MDQRPGISKSLLDPALMVGEPVEEIVGENAAL
jgi:hypothetical protein